MTTARNRSHDWSHVSLGIAIGTRLRRTSLRLTQTQLAEQAGISRSHVSAIERCRANPSLTTLLDLAQALAYPNLGAFYSASLDAADRLDASVLHPAT